MDIPTIKDVADSTGVSVSTVSRVLNGFSNVNDDTKQRVLKAVKELGYRPNALARGLRSQRTRTIGLVVNNILNPIYAVMAQGIEDTARSKGFHLFLCNSAAKPEQEAAYLDALMDKRIDGLIIAPTGSNLDKLEKCMQANIPIVQVDRQVPELQTGVVLTNNEKGAHDVTAHLLERGYRKIAIIVGMQTVTTGMLRLTGYFHAMQEYGLGPRSSYVKIGDFSESSGYDLMRELWQQDERPDAVFVGNNLMARGAIRLIREQEISIPRDLAFSMFDDPDWAELHQPSITVVRQPTYDVGVVAAKLLFKAIEKGVDPEPVVLDNEVVVRGST